MICLLLVAAPLLKVGRLWHVVKYWNSTGSTNLALVISMDIQQGEKYA